MTMAAGAVYHFAEQALRESVQLAARWLEPVGKTRREEAFKGMRAHGNPSPYSILDSEVSELGCT